MPLNRPLVLLLVVYLALGVLYSVTTPLFEAPDEQWHFAFVQQVAAGRGLPVQSSPLQHLARQEGSQPPLYYAIAAALTFWVNTSDYPAILWENPHYGYDVPGVVNDNKNLFIHTAQEAFPYQNTALAMHLARLLSLAFGAVAVYFTYRLTLEIRASLGSSAIALAAAALVAFTPQFLFISSAVSNDSAVAAFAALGLFLLVRACYAPPSLRAAILIGVVCGLSALTKVSGAALFPLALIVLGIVNRRRPRQLVLQFAAATLAFGLIAGWWYLRNLLLYGELTGTARMLQIFGARATPLPLDQWRAQLYEVFETFWLGLGWGNIRAPEWVYGTLGLAAALGLVGLTAGLVRRRQNLRAAIQANLPLVILAAWVAIVFIALMRWMMLTQAPHGRLLFPGLPAIAALVVIGWTQLIPPRARTPLLRAVTLALLALAAAVPVLLLRPAYALPPLLDESAVNAIPARVDIRYGSSLMLLGSRVAPHPLNPRGALEVTLYWRVLAPMERDYSLNLAALDASYRVVGSRNSYPGHGTLPTRLMQPGQIIQDTYWLPLTTLTARGSIQVSVFDRVTQQDLPAADPNNNEITPIVNTFQIPENSR